MPIRREQKPANSLLDELLPPHKLPDGVLFVLGTQELVVPDVVSRHTQREGRHVSIEPVISSAVRRVLHRAGLRAVLDEDQSEACVAKIKGHPLILGLLINALNRRTGPEDIPRILQEADNYQGDILEFYDGYCSRFEDGDETVLDALACWPASTRRLTWPGCNAGWMPAPGGHPFAPGEGKRFANKASKPLA